MQAEIPADGSAYLDFARDIFLFSYLSAGINFKDIATLRYCDMDEERIYYARHKTSKEMTCHLSEQSKAIIGNTPNPTMRTRIIFSRYSTAAYTRPSNRFTTECARC